MAIENYRAPALPLPPAEYSQRHLHQLINVLRLYFNQLDANNANKAYSYRANKIILDPGNAVTESPGTLSWNAVDGTANLGLDYGVTNQIGEEYYARVANTTGVTIPNGTVVGFAGATSDALLVAPYLADGTSPTLYILGVMTHDLPDSGDKGYCTVWGFVRDLDTSAFSAGDVLYASPTVAGGLTNVKPTAPDNVVPVAACIVSDPQNGVIFVRPTIEQQKYYGTFSSNSSFTPAAIYTPYALTFTTVDAANGFSIGSPTSRIVAAQSGYYNFQFSLQVSSGSASQKKLWIWARVNGTDVPDSNSEVTVQSNGGVLVPSWNWALSLDAGDYFELMYAVDDVDISIVTFPAQTGAVGTATFARPAAPAVILVVTQVQQ